MCENIAMERKKLDQRVTFVTWREQLARIDDWRTKRRPVPSRNEAIRALLDYALDIKEREQDQGERFKP